jgi:hypothetical protein
MRLPPTRRQVRVALGALWLVDAGLQAQPQLFSPEWWRGDLAQSVMGQPASVSHSIWWAVGIIAPHAAAWNALFVTLQAALGLALVAGRFERAAVAASIPWTLAVWWVGEGLGTLPTGFAILPAGAPGPALFYTLVGLLAWPRADSRERVVNQSWGVTAWALLWAGQTLLLAQGVFPVGQVLRANVAENALGEPGALASVARHVEALVGAHPVAVAVALAVVQLAVGLGVLAGETARSLPPALTCRVRLVALVAGIVLSALFWVTVQYFGTIPAGSATDPGSAPLLILLAVALWPPPAGEARAVGAEGTAPPMAALATQRRQRRPPRVVQP